MGSMGEALLHRSSVSRSIPDRLLPDRVAIRRPVQSFAPSTKRPVFQFETIASGVRARFNPDKTALNRNVLGQTPKKAFQLFLNPREFHENYEVVDESTGKSYVAVEVKNYFGHHLEAVLEEKKA